MPPVVAVFNHKGGVAKTTSAVNFGVCLAAHGYRVLLIDLDPQANATAGFGHQPLPTTGAWDVLTGHSGLAAALLPTPYPGLVLLPATGMLRTAEVDLAAEDVDAFSRLKTGLAGELKSCCDVAVIDCPPAFAVMTLNALLAATAVLIPTRPDPFAHEGLVNTWYEIRRLREGANSGLSVAGVLLTMTEAEGAIADGALAIRAEFGEHVFPMEIALDPRVGEAVQLSMPIAVLDPDGLAGRAYFDATEELIARVSAHVRPDIHLPMPAGRDHALNTLREWRSDSPALRRLPAQRGWTKRQPAPYGQAEPPSPFTDPPISEIAREDGMTAAWVVGALAIGAVIGMLAQHHWQLMR
ncbi:MAG: ParA family protein [Magnetospirillum sp.]|nr:ParA family protein [Magnetospirillum sp.]